MAVDKPINPEPSPIENLSSIDIPLKEETEVVETDDGGAIIGEMDE